MILRCGTFRFTSFRPTTRRASGLQLGALGILPKPIQTRETLERTFDRIKAFVDQAARRLLLVAPQADVRQAIVDLIGGDDTETAVAESPDDALARLQQRRFDCVVWQSAEMDDSLPSLPRPPESCGTKQPCR